MNNRNVIGLDLAKNVFQLHIADPSGRKLKTMRIRRNQMMQTFAALPPALVGMEACSSAHYWARQIKSMGHEVKIMPPQHVKPYVQGNKTDARDAAAICEAATRNAVPAVLPKTVEQQQMQALHRVREGWMKQRVAISNQIRGLLAEWGVAFPKKYANLKKELPVWLATEEVPMMLSELVRALFEQITELDHRIARIEGQIRLMHKDNAASRLIESIPGVGLLTATAMIAAVGDASHYRSGRTLASAMGLTPKEFSSGESRRQTGISKRGNGYLRQLLIHGARAVVLTRKRHPRGDWLDQLIARRGHNIAVVALAAKNVRRIWAMLQTGEVYDPDRAMRQILKAA